MKRVGLGLLLGLVACWPGMSDAGYVIRLKNGNEFFTARYWHEGSQVLFDTYGGIFGVDKRLVIKIESSTRPMRLASIAPAPAEKQPVPSAAQEAKKNPAPNENKQTKADPKRHDDPIVKDFSALKEKFTGLDGMLTSELQALSKELASLKRRIQTSGNSNDYLPEFTEAFQMGDRLEAALNSRR